jgi:hypothetical protein
MQLKEDTVASKSAWRRDARRPAVPRLEARTQRRARVAQFTGLRANRRILQYPATGNPASDLAIVTELQLPGGLSKPEVQTERTDEPQQLYLPQESTGGRLKMSRNVFAPTSARSGSVASTSSSPAPPACCYRKLVF